MRHRLDGHRRQLGRDHGIVDGGDARTRQAGLPREVVGDTVRDRDDAVRQPVGVPEQARQMTIAPAVLAAEHGRERVALADQHAGRHAGQAARPDRQEVGGRHGREQRVGPLGPQIAHQARQVREVLGRPPGEQDRRQHGAQAGRVGSQRQGAGDRHRRRRQQGHAHARRHVGE